MGVCVERPGGDRAGAALTEEIGKLQEEGAAQATQELVEGRRVLDLQQDNDSQQLHGIPDCVEVRDPVFEEEDES